MAQALDHSNDDNAQADDDHTPRTMTRTLRGCMVWSSLAGDATTTPGNRLAEQPPPNYCGAEDAGERLDRFLARAERLAGLSRSRLKQLIEAGHVSTGGATLPTRPTGQTRPGFPGGRGPKR